MGKNIFQDAKKTQKYKFLERFETKRREKRI